MAQKPIKVESYDGNKPCSMCVGTIHNAIYICDGTLVCHGCYEKIRYNTSYSPKQVLSQKGCNKKQTWKAIKKRRNRAKRALGYIYDKYTQSFVQPNELTKSKHDKPAPFKEDDPAMELWRHIIYKKDKYTCQMCNAHGMLCHAHHVYSRFKYPQLRHHPDNGVCLCKECHFTRVHQNGESCEVIDARKALLAEYT
jgi:hypothetical protein